MQDVTKITLSPTHIAKPYAPDAVGSILIDEAAGRVSINLFNLPEPTDFLPSPTSSARYKGWFYHPQTRAVLPIGTLSSGGEHLYFLYDAPLLRGDGFHEVIVTAEDADGITPQGEILLIGYLAQEQTRSMTPFQPFDPPLPNHKWWRIQRDPYERSTSRQQTALFPDKGAYSTLSVAIQQTPVPVQSPYATPYSTNINQTLQPCDYCPQRQHMLPSLPASVSELARERDGFHLPHLIGMVTDESGLLSYMIHGIPGRLLRSDQPDQGRTGYLHWQPYYGIEERIGAIGYWLCYIHPETNQVATPLGVTIPPG